MKLFDHLKNLTKTKQLSTEEDLKSYDNFMINRFVSMSDVFLPTVCELNQYEIPKEVHQRFMIGFLPNRDQYWNYIKKSKKDDNKFELECLMLFYEIGPNEAKMYYNDLTDAELKTITDKYHFLRN